MVAKKKVLPSSLLKKLHWIKWLVAAMAAWTVVGGVGEKRRVQDHTKKTSVIYVKGRAIFLL
jgi:hypothetical protein